MSTLVLASSASPPADARARAKSLEPFGNSCTPGFITAPSTVTRLTAGLSTCNVTLGRTKMPRSIAACTIFCSAAGGSNPATGTGPMGGAFDRAIALRRGLELV